MTSDDVCADGLSEKRGTLDLVMLDQETTTRHMKRLFAVAWCAAVGLWGCNFDPIGLQESQDERGSFIGTGPADGSIDARIASDGSAPPIDSDIAFDAGQVADRGKPDAIGADLAVDMRLPDARLPDGGLPDTFLNCEMQYGRAPAFQLCRQTASICKFYTRPSRGSCSEVCARFGGRCLRADDDHNDSCKADGRLRCGQSHTDLICTCSR